jgi:serine O-acetyltransferase
MREANGNMVDRSKRQDTCKIDAHSLTRIRNQLPKIADDIIANCHDRECYTHVDYEPIPSKEGVIEIIDGLREILFPGYFTRGKLDPVNLRYSMGTSVATLFDILAEQICRSIRHDCFRYDQPCSDCEEQGHRLALKLLEQIPSIRKILATDVRASYEGDPAAKSFDEIIFSYPGIYAMTVYRAAHKLFEFGVPLLPRIMTEHAHSVTGIDIHPGAEIGESFVIDHGTGVVIGETTQIGNSVRIYQGVTLGALSLPKNAGDQFRGKKRHPTIEDEVIIYSGATILGGDTVIGARSVIGGNIWLTESVPPDTTVVIETPRLIYKSKKESPLRQTLNPAA